MDCWKAEDRGDPIPPNCSSVMPGQDGEAGEGHVETGRESRLLGRRPHQKDENKVSPRAVHFLILTPHMCEARGYTPQ